MYRSDSSALGRSTKPFIVTPAPATIPEIPGQPMGDILVVSARRWIMTSERQKARAQYLNSLAVAVLTGSVSAVISGAAPFWLLVPAAMASVALHAGAVWIVGRAR